MSKIRWYKRNPADHINGTRDLSLEQRGAYSDIIELIYMHDGRLKDDDAFVAGCLHCGTRKYRAIKASLLASGKLYQDGGFLRNKRCDYEAANILKLLRTSAENGVKSGQTRRVLSLISKD